MGANGSFDESWEKLYSVSNSKHLNKYPYGVLVSVFFQNLKHIKTGSSNRRLLEVGCGVGNNLPVFLNEGFHCSGIDGSTTVLKIAAERLSDWKDNLSLDVGDIDHMPYAGNSFDMVIDRQAIYANTKENIFKIFEEVLRVLKPGGVFVSFMYNTDDYHMEMVKADENYAKRIEENTYTKFKGGTFEGTGITHFFTEEEVKVLCSGRFNIISLSESRKDTLFPTNRNELAEFILVARAEKK